MYPDIPPNLKWVKPWEPLEDSDEAKDLVEELQDEMPPQHILYGVPVIGLARRIDCDDVLFMSSDPSKPLALVHLTWHRETDPKWPSTTIYQSWQEWIEYCLLPAHHDYLKH